VLAQVLQFLDRPGCVSLAAGITGPLVF
jgi:hypothetical protein